VQDEVDEKLFDVVKIIAGGDAVLAWIHLKLVLKKTGAEAMQGLRMPWGCPPKHARCARCGTLVSSMISYHRWPSVG
jgi:hypothetical protein